LEHASTLGAESLSDSGSRSPGALDFGRPGRDRGARVGHGVATAKGRLKFEPEASGRLAQRGL